MGSFSNWAYEGRFDSNMMYTYLILPVLTFKDIFILTITCWSYKKKAETQGQALNEDTKALCSTLLKFHLEHRGLSNVHPNVGNWAGYLSTLQGK